MPTCSSLLGGVAGAQVGAVFFGERGLSKIAGTPYCKATIQYDAYHIYLQGATFTGAKEVGLHTLRDVTAAHLIAFTA